MLSAGRIEIKSAKILLIARRQQMKKVQLISIEEKKEAQIKEDIELGPRGRFHKMFDLISLSIMFSPEGKLKTLRHFNVIELKRKA